MRKFLLSAAGLLIGVSAYSQQDYQLSQYMFDRLSFNPAFAGIDNKICATGIFRQQWAGFTGSPQTMLLNVHGPVKQIRGGAGLSLYNDKIGFFNNFALKASYSYHLTLGTGILGIGVSAGFMSVSVKPTWVAITSPTLDDAIPDNNVSQTTYDLGFGLYYRANNWYAGLSATHLTESDITKLNVKNTRHYFITAGYDYQLNQQLTLRPSFIVKSDATSTQLDVNFNALYSLSDKNGIWAGVSYRVKDAIVPMVGYQQALGDKNPGMLRIGYTYDVTTSEIKSYSSGSHEIMVNYCFNINPVPKIQKSKTVRFL